MRLGILGTMVLWLASANVLLAQPQPPNRAANGYCSDNNCATCDPGLANAFNGPDCADCCRDLNAFNADPCCNTTCFWANADFAYYFLRSGPLPPLVTTVNPNINPPLPGTVNNLGILGRPSTAVVYGVDPVGLKDVLGGKVSAGFWFNKEQNVGIEANYLQLEEVRNSFNQKSDLAGSPVLSRPYVDALNPPTAPTNGNTVLSVSVPDLFSGSVGSYYITKFYGLEGSLVLSPWDEYFDYADFLLGFRYLDLDESLSISQTSSLLPAGVGAFNGATVAAPGAFALSDRFATRNQFYGGNLGIRFKIERSIFFLKMTGKVGVGETRQTGFVNGSTSFGTGAAGSLMTLPGGLLALTSNMGRFTNSEFSVVPEAEIRFGVRLSRCVNVSVGYNYLWWSNVARPGDSIDRQINPQLLPTSLQYGMAGGPANPAFRFVQSDFWAHGLTVGLGVEF